MSDRAEGVRMRNGTLLALALALVATAYSNALAGPFVWDDRPLILEQAEVHRLDAPSRLFTDAFWARNPGNEADDAYYRPLVTLSYALNWAASGPRPAPFHLTNLLLHLVACALLFAVALRFGAPPPAAAAAAALVGVLPRLTECVTWISGRTDVLAAIFALGALVLHRSDRGAQLRRWAAAGLLLLGLLSKEVAIAGFAALVALELRACEGSGRLRRLLVNLSPMVVALVIYAALRTRALAGVPSQNFRAPLATTLATATQAMGGYLLMALDPLRPRLQIGLAGRLAPGYLAAGIVAVTLILLGLRQGLRARWPAGVWAGVALTLTSLALVLHVVPLRVNTLTADRFLYFPAIGLGLALAIAAGRLKETRRRVALGAVVVSLPLLAFRTSTRNQDWADELRLWRVAVASSPPQNVLPRAELGNALFRRGLFAEARAEWEAALPFADPVRRPYVVGNLASAESELGRYDEARALTRSLLETEPELPLHHYNLGVIEARALRLDVAERELRRALELLPDYGQAARALEMVREAREELRRLPPEVEGEPLSTRAARAALDQRLGRRVEAGRRWAGLLESGATTPAQTWEAARFLLVSGTQEGARIALQKLAAARLVSPDELEALRQERARREAEGELAEDPRPRGAM